MHKRLSLEMGGKNAQIVLDDADLDLALDGVLWGAFGTTGQRCTATSRLILQDGIHDEFVSRLVERVAVARAGRRASATGPMWDRSFTATRWPRSSDTSRSGRKRARLLLAVVEGAPARASKTGYFFEPTIFTGVRPGSRLEQEEIFGPVLSVIRVRISRRGVRGQQRRVATVCRRPSTRGTCSVAFRALQELDNGITYVNAPTIGAEAHLPFGGVKQTGNGHREGGWEVYEFYSETKVGYVDYSGVLQRAQIDNLHRGLSRLRRCATITCGRLWQWLNCPQMQLSKVSCSQHVLRDSSGELAVSTAKRS